MAMIFRQSRRGLLLPLWYLFASLYVVAVLARPVYGFRSAARVVSSARAQRGATSTSFIHRQGNLQRVGVDLAFVLPLEAQRRGRNSRREAMAGAGGASMISSMFRWRKNEEDEAIVNIEAPSSNSRRISSSIVVNRPVADVWRILTDYDNLATYVPNLTQSKTLPKGPNDPVKGVRLFQEGAQKIIGFNFKASLTMDMEEVFEGEDEKLGQRKIKFKLVDSAMFNDFSGEWRLQCYSRIKTDCGDGEMDYTYSTKLFYMVTVKPKGPVPVAALEWRIKEDVPINLKAVKEATEALPWDCDSLRASAPASPQFLQDETLQAYMPCTIPADEGMAPVAVPANPSSQSKTSGGGSSGAAKVPGASSVSRPGVNAAFFGRATALGGPSR